MEKPANFAGRRQQYRPKRLAAIREDPFTISEAAKGTYIKARDRRILEDNRRQIAEAEQRQREFEKQQAAEAGR